MPTIKRDGQTNKWIAERKPQQGRTVDNSKFYNSTAWRNLRASHIKDNPLCVQCKSEDIITDATGRNGVVDHIKPINQGGEPLDPDNLQTLCNRHHNIKSAKEKNHNRVGGG